MGFSGDQTNTSTASSAPSNPNVTNTINQLLTQGNNSVQGVFGNGPTYVGPGSTTQAAQASALGAANNPGYTGALNDAVSNASKLISAQGSPGLAEQNLLGVAQGQDLNGMNDPGYQAARNATANTVLTNIANQFNNSGRFGGGSYVQAAATGLGNALGGMDYANYQNQLARQQNAISSIDAERQNTIANAGNAASALPNYYQSLLAPSSTQAAVGQAQDIAAQNKANAPMSLLANLSSILNGTASGAGTTMTYSQPATPWYQSVLGGLVSVL